MRTLPITSLILSLCLSACSHLPTLTQLPAPIHANDSQADCKNAFPTTPWQLFHAITATFPGDHRGVFTGVTIVHPDSRTLRVVLMSLEGMVLFDGESTSPGSEGLVVHRAVGPFEKLGFAQGLLDDVRMVFLSPTETDFHAGMGPDGVIRCRAELPEGGWLDVVPPPAGGWTLESYDHRRRRIRTVTGNPEPEKPLALAATIELVAPGPQAYSLTLKLVDAVPLNP